MVRERDGERVKIVKFDEKNLKNIKNGYYLRCRYSKNSIFITLFIYDINTKLNWLLRYETKTKIAKN